MEDDYKAKIQKLGGFGVPLNMFLFQEIQRLQEVIAKVRIMLRQMRLAIKGEVVMTDELASAIDKIGDSKAPYTWVSSTVLHELSTLPPTHQISPILSPPSWLSFSLACVSRLPSFCASIFALRHFRSPFPSHLSFHSSSAHRRAPPVPLKCTALPLPIALHPCGVMFTHFHRTHTLSLGEPFLEPSREAFEL